MIFVCTTTLEQKLEIKNETDFSSLKENILTSSPNNSQTIKTETKQDSQSKTLHGLSFLN